MSSKSQNLHYDRRSVGQSVLVSTPIRGPWLLYLFFFVTIFRQFPICWCGTLSLKRGRVCKLQLLSVLNAVPLGQESAGLTIITVSNLILPHLKSHCLAVTGHDSPVTAQGNAFPRLCHLRMNKDLFPMRTSAWDFLTVILSLYVVRNVTHHCLVTIHSWRGCTRNLNCP
jgi:hypothetical protein